MPSASTWGGPFEAAMVICSGGPETEQDAGGGLPPTRSAGSGHQVSILAWDIRLQGRQEAHATRAS